MTARVVIFGKGKALATTSPQASLLLKPGKAHPALLSGALHSVR